MFQKKTLVMLIAIIAIAFTTSLVDNLHATKAGGDLVFIPVVLNESILVSESNSFTGEGTQK